MVSGCMWMYVDVCGCTRGSGVALEWSSSGPVVYPGGSGLSGLLYMYMLVSQGRVPGYPKRTVLLM